MASGEKRRNVTTRSRIIAFGLFSLIVVLFFAATGRSQGANFKPSSADSSGSGVQIIGNVSQCFIQKGEKTSFFLWIVNNTPQPIQDLQFDELHAEGLQIAMRSWCLVSDTNCAQIKPKLDPGQSVAIWGQLLGVQAREKESVVAEVRWTDIGKNDSTRFVQLGEVAVQTGWEHWRQSWVYDLLKDITLPFVLVVLGTALGLYDKAKENRRNRRDKELEEARKKDAELRAQTAQTWSSMLPESHTLATQYYMPVDGATSAALDELIAREKAIKEGHDSLRKAAEERAFYYLLLMSRRCRALADEKGGWYFKDRIGEQLVARCLENFRVLLLAEPADAQTKWSVATGVVDARQKLGPFQTALLASDGTGAILREAQRNFLAWLVSPNLEPALQNLRAMRMILTYEMNRPYEYWYGSCDKLILSEDVKKTLRKAASISGSFPSIPPADVEAYFQRGENPTKVTVPD